jgi:hypothetical protein
MRKYLLAAFVLFMTFGVATLAGAQDSPRRDEGGAKVQGRAGDTNFDVRVQGEKGEQAQRSPQGPEGERERPGPEGPAGAPGPQGAPGPSGPSGGTTFGMDPGVAMLVGLGVLAVVIVAIVAASRGRE